MRIPVKKQNWLLLHKFMYPDSYIKKWVEDDMKYIDHFHDDYGEIMLVVDKIETIKINDYTFVFEIYDKCCVIRAIASNQIIEDIFHTLDKKYKNKITAIYETCVRFVKFYNQQK